MKLGIICIGKKIPLKNIMGIVRVIMIMLAVSSSSAIDVSTMPNPTKLKTPSKTVMSTHNMFP